MGKRSKVRQQYAALPYRVSEGRHEVMLVTSRETRRWIIPKGWPEDDLTPSEVAAREAFEEAGLLGRAGAEPIGRFEYDKRLRSGRAVPCVVDIFLLRVEQELDEWPEKGQRERRWCSPSQAALLVGEAGLIELLLRFGAAPR